MRDSGSEARPGSLFESRCVRPDEIPYLRRLPGWLTYLHCSFAHCGGGSLWRRGGGDHLSFDNKMKLKIQTRKPQTTRFAFTLVLQDTHTSDTLQTSRQQQHVHVAACKEAHHLILGMPGTFPHRDGKTKLARHDLPDTALVVCTAIFLIIAEARKTP